jgi:Pentapeptide repeats (8 copies)
MNNPTSRASRRVRFEEVTPAHEYAAFFDVSIAPLVAHLGLPIFDGYDDLDDLQLAFLTLPSGETVTLGEYASMPGTSLYIEVAMQSISQIIFDSCQQLRVSRQEIEWVHPDRQAEFDRLYAEHGEIEGIDRSSTAVLSQSEDREPIDCFYHALEIYTRPKFPEHWAMLQHNLGLAYFDRSKGERWQNLQDSIRHYYKSLEVFTQDKFPKKWQINQEDLSQSLKVWEVERPNLIRDILDRPRASRNLKYADLSGVNLIGAKLRYVRLRGANLLGINLLGADLIGANLIGVNLSSANLSGAKLMGANLSNASLIDANLRGANLSDVSLIDANLSNADLSGARLMSVSLMGANLYKAKFEYNEGISESMRKDLISRGAIFEDSPGDRSESRTLVPR